MRGQNKRYCMFREQCWQKPPCHTTPTAMAMIPYVSSANGRLGAIVRGGGMLLGENDELWWEYQPLKALSALVNADGLNQ